jgi:carboxyl-terminal processing protease
MPGSPSQIAGLKAGDILISINGESVEGWTQHEAVNHLRGPKGTKVTLEVRHLEKEELSIITVVRDVIKIESVSGSLIENNIGYIAIGAFYQNTREDFLEKLQELQSSGAEGLIVDLRNNPGGLLSITNQITDEFLKGGIITYQKDANGKRTDFTASDNGMALEIPLVVLVNNYSASGSEILAGAIQDYHRGTIIGTRTLGKGTVNKLQKLSDGGSLYYSFARWYTPNGNMIEENGLEPDIIIQSGSENDGDIQLSKAIEILYNAIKIKT